MATFTYPGITFHDEGENIRCRLFTRYWFDLKKEDVEKAGKVIVTREALTFPDSSEKKVINKIGRLVNEGLDRKLTNSLYQKRTIYLCEESGIPLIGSNEFGVVDRGSNILELKPLTGCNFNCTYCSVDEGKNRKLYDYLVEREYLVTVTAAIAATKKHPVECNIGPHGEPTLYPELVELVADLAAIPNVKIISMNTNGALLSKQLIDDLAAAGLTRINLSLPALDATLAAELAGIPTFPLTHLLAMLDYGKEKINFLLAPVLISGKNEAEMAKIVELSKNITSDYPTIGIQNYLEYQKGRKAGKQLSWEEFFAFIKQLEKQTGKNLTSTKEEFCIHEEKELEKPFKKRQVIEATIVMPGRYPKEMYAAAGDRVILVMIPNKEEAVGRRIKVKLVRDKHNIYKGVPA